MTTKDEKEFEIYFGVILKVRACDQAHAFKKATENCPEFVKEIPLSANAIIEKKAFWEVNDAHYNECIHGVPLSSGTYVEGFKTTDNPKCKKCVANVNDKCTSYITISKIPEIHDGECMGYNRG